MRYMALALVLALGLVPVCGFSQETDQTEAPADSVRAEETDQALASEPAPAGAPYSIADTRVTEDVKRSLFVDLKGAVAAGVLDSLSLHLRSLDPEEYAETYIAYSLPGDDGEPVPWAIARFTPDLKTEFLGLVPQAPAPAKVSAEESGAGSSTQRVVVGRWKDDGILVDRYTLYRQGPLFYLKMEFTDGSSTTRRVEERSVSRGTRYDMVQRSRWGDYWLLTHSGNLESRDNEGLISTAHPIK